MSRVDFYILPENSNRQRFACSLTGKAWQSGNNIYIHTMRKEDAVMLDDLLWTFHDISFIPHVLIEEYKGDETPVFIGWNGKLPDNCQVMINLSETVPEFVDKFERIAEIVAGDDAQRKKARDRYRHYRDKGYDLYDHKIEGDYDHT